VSQRICATVNVNELVMEICLMKIKLGIFVKLLHFGFFWLSKLLEDAQLIQIGFLALICTVIIEILPIV
jgi:hypothetical protein